MSCFAISKQAKLHYMVRQMEHHLCLRSRTFIVQGHLKVRCRPPHKAGAYGGKRILMALFNNDTS